MDFTIAYHPSVKSDDLPLINPNIQKRIKVAIEKRLMIAPHRYGKPLRRTLKGYWKLRVGDYRVVFTILNTTVYVFCICHRKAVYQVVFNRV